MVRILDFGVDDGVPFIAMELLEGEDLGARLARVGALSVGALVAVAAQIASALKTAHHAGVLHRDLKPENVFVVRRDDEERIKLLDFGLAKRIEPGLVAQPAQPMGTLHYMAPELLTSHRIDHRADLWSFAVVLYRAVTGALPFDNENLAELVMDICTGPIRRPPPSSPRSASGSTPSSSARCGAIPTRGSSRPRTWSAPSPRRRGCRGARPRRYRRRRSRPSCRPTRTSPGRTPRASASWPVASCLRLILVAPITSHPHRRLDQPSPA